MTFTTFRIPTSLSPSGLSSMAPPDSSQDPQLRRKDIGSCPLGTKGNLQLMPCNMGTAPATRIGVLFSEIRRSLADKLVSLKFKLTQSSEARAQREKLVEARVEARANSRRIGNLLGSLTAKVNGGGDFVNCNDCLAIAQALKELNVPSDGGLYSLKGAKYCLGTYLNEAGEHDLIVLRDGVLSNEDACKELLDKISPDRDNPLRIQASQVLGDIAAAVNQQLARRAAHDPVQRIVGLLAASPIDGKELHEQLMRIPNFETTLAYYFQALTKDEFQALLDTKLSESLDTAYMAHLRATRGYTSRTVDSVGSLFAIEFVRRAPPEFAQRVNELSVALIEGDQLNVSDALHRLSLAVKATYQDWKKLPDLANFELQSMVKDSMSLFRDWGNNWDGPLNWHSLSKLDDDTRANLSAAALVLDSFGLKLAVDPDLRDS